jgi:SpoVK/Ycf46/Vps4 family AAA+-type ATPase
MASFQGTDPLRELELLIKSRYPIIYLETWEEERAEELISLVAKNLGKPLFLWTATKGLFRWGAQNAIYNTTQPLQVLTHIASTDLMAIYLLKDFHQYLEDPVVIRKLKDIASVFEKKDGCIILSSSVVKIPAELRKIAVHFELKLPSSEEIRKIILETIEELRHKTHIHIGINTDEFNQMADRLKGLTKQEAKRIVCQAVLRDNQLTKEDIPRILESKKQIIEQSSILEIYYSEDSLSSVGGMENLKAWLDKRKKAIGEKAKRFGLQPPKGILILGVQGCGKSLLAKTVAQDWALPLLRLDPGKIYDKYIGESEKNLRQALEIAESMAPVVLWIDEIEKGFSYSQFSDADSGLSKRIFGNFLTWLQEKKEMVFVVATSNDILSLPPEILRKGRFDEIFFVDLPDFRERKEIFIIHLKRRNKNPDDFNIDRLAEETKGFSGAEIEQTIISALYSAYSGSGNLTTELILEEIENTRPLSVMVKEKIEDLRRWARERSIPAGKDFNQEPLE